jgi:sterol desaturase/sphingolipid hydroxylase (fatty acid hydroxylase superfamily)
MDSLREQWLILISTPIYLVVIGIELMLSHLQHKKVYTFKDTVTNIYLMLLNSGIDLIFRLFYVGVWQDCFLHAWHTWVNYGWTYWVLLLLGEDFLYYWLHRFDDEIRFFWATHVTHHSSPVMNFTVGFRSSVFEPLYRFIYFIPLAWLGFRPVDILFMYSATQIWGIFVHTECIGKLGWLEYIFVTPSHHRVHNGSNPKYLDKNMGMFLIICDKLFNTFQEEIPAEQYQPIHYGLTKNLEKPNAFTIIFHEWIAICKDALQKGLTFKERLGYIFGPPGWSHDGSRQTSKDLQAMENLQRSFETGIPNNNETTSGLQVQTVNVQ